MGEWRFHCHDLSTVAPLGTVKMSSWYHEDRLNEPGQFAATLAPPEDDEHARAILAATLPARSTIWALRVDDFGSTRSEYTAWIPPGGRVIPTLAGRGLQSFYDSQVIKQQLILGEAGDEMEQVEQIGRLVQYADYTITEVATGNQFQPGPKVDLNNLFASGVLRQQTYNAWDRKNLGEAIRDIAGRIDGVDFAINTEFQSIGNGAFLPIRRLRCYYPRRGRTYAESQVRFTYGNNLIGFPEIGSNQDYITSALGVGQEIDADTQERLTVWHVNFTQLSEGNPLIDAVLDRQDITTTGGLEDRVQGALLANWVSNADEITIQVDPNDETYRWGSWQLGDDCLLVIPGGEMPWWPNDFQEERRIVAHRWTVNGEGEQLHVVLGRKWEPTT
jgi:hypothetical protein